MTVLTILDFCKVTVRFTSASAVAQGCTAKAKKLPKLSPETKADIEAFEGKLEAAAAERREEQATAMAALQHSGASDDMDTDTGEPTACVAPMTLLLT